MRCLFGLLHRMRNKEYGSSYTTYLQTMSELILEHSSNVTGSVTLRTVTNLVNVHTYKPLIHSAHRIHQLIHFVQLKVA